MNMNSVWDLCDTRMTEGQEGIGTRESTRVLESLPGGTSALFWGTWEEGEKASDPRHPGNFGNAPSWLRWHSLGNTCTTRTERGDTSLSCLSWLSLAFCFQLSPPWPRTSSPHHHASALSPHEPILRIIMFMLLLLSRFSRVWLVWPHRRQPIRLPRPWDSPGKNTGVGCHFLLQRMKMKSESEVAQSCLTLSDPMDCSLPGSSVHGIFQARVLEWGAIAFSETWP